MKIYTTGEKPSRQPSYVMSVAPAADELFLQKFPGEVPSEWVDANNVPLQVNVEFTWGEAEVSDSLGRYLVQMGYVKATRLILPSELGQQSAGIDTLFSLLG